MSPKTFVVLSILTVVALGAAIQGAALVDESHDMVLLDVTPHTLGIMVVGGYFEELIPQNSTVPTSRSKIFTTVRENQTAVKILVMQGESRRADENELLGEFILTGLRRAQAGQVEVEVTFEINADGIVSVHAKDLETGKVEITSQNHNYCVEEGSIPSSQLTHVNLNDQTVEGIRCNDVPAFSVQYHPEAGPGPHDSRYLFGEFEDLMAAVVGPAGARG